MPTLYQLETVLAWIVIVTPAYIELTHKLDTKNKWLGLRHLRSEMTDSERDPFRRTLRLEMLAINSGFAATFFLLSLQLMLDAPEGSDRFLALATMIVLFFCATVLNILQLVLYDFRLAVEKHPDFVTIKKSITGRLTFFGQFAWHLQIAAVIVGFALIDLTLCVAMNLVYGILLFSYYFHNRRAKPPTDSKVSTNDAQAAR